MAGPELTSLRSARVTSVRRLAKRAFRARERRFVAEGPQAVREAVAAATAGTPGAVHDVFVTPDAAERHADLVAAARSAGLDVTVATVEVVGALSQTVTPQGVVAVCGFLDVSLESVLAASPRLVAVMAHVRDPGNAGTVLRAADAAGADAVVFTDASVDPYNSKCVRASAGSLWHLPVVVGVPSDALFPALRGAGLTVLAADGGGARDLDDAEDGGLLDAPTAWVFGNEAWGLPAETVARCDEAVRVPIHGRAESLNLATAAAVTLYASARAHRRP
jgi:TrmH family RNA methyltransferase